MEKRRRYKRFSLEVMQVRGRMLSATEVRILEISLSEVTLKADMRMDMGNEYSLKLKDKDGFISLRGIVLWSSLSESRKTPDGSVIPIYTAGMQFKDLSGDAMLGLAKFIEAQTEEEEDRVSSIRLRVDEAKKAIVDFPESYTVKKISLGGMLVETMKEVETEKRSPMELSLPEGDPIRFLGRVASCLAISGREPERYDIGIEFIDLADEDRERLKHFISSLEEPVENS